MSRKLSEAELSLGKLIMIEASSLSIKNYSDPELRYLNWVRGCPTLSQEHSLSFMNRFSPKKDYKENLVPILQNYHSALRRAREKAEDLSR